MAEFKDTEKKISEKEIIKEIEAENEKEYLRELKKKQAGYLVENLSILERERVAKHIIDMMNDNEDKHNELCDKIDEYDEVYRMERKEVQGSDGDMPNYRSALSTVSTEVIHANIMNVFFTPKDIGNILPTEEGDIPKIEKLTTFMNWSVKEELEIFENIDRLFHNSTKIGEAPYIVHWVKQFGTRIKKTTIPDPTNPQFPLYDPDTKEPLYQEVEEEVLLYNAPKLEIFSRKNYRIPKNATMNKIPDWEARDIRLTYDEYLREELAGKMYSGTIQEIKDWSNANSAESSMLDYEGDTIPTGKFEKEFREFYGRLRIKTIKDSKTDAEAIEIEELESEFIALVNVESGILCSLRKNRFPYQMRPIGIDYFIPDDEGRRVGIGVVEFMSSLQKAYDALYNLFITGTTNANNPIIMAEPTGNQKDEKIKLQNGFLYYTANAQSAKFFQFPAPDASLSAMLALITQWSQLLFGISDYSAGIDSRTDPEAPAKKTEIVVQQGNVRMNAIIKRKNKTIRDILKRWFLLYQENLPPNKFMRIVGDSTSPFKFQQMNLEDFSIQGIPDFELTGNILNSNKSLMVNRKIAMYQLLISNPFFNPQLPQGLQALLKLTKWLIDGLDEMGLSSFLPQAPGEEVQTPEEENARFLQGDEGSPAQGEDHLGHMPVHRQLLLDPTVPDDIKINVLNHIKETVAMIQQEQTARMVMMQMPQGGMNAQPRGNLPTAAGTGQGVFPTEPAGMV